MTIISRVWAFTMKRTDNMTCWNCICEIPLCLIGVILLPFALVGDLITCCQCCKGPVVVAR